MSEQDNANAVRAREHAEPVERGNPVPWLLGLVAAALAVWGVSYFLLNPALGPGSTVARGAMPGGPGTVAVAQDTPDGAMLFASRCASCHQATGAGLPGVFPPLAGSEWVNGDPKRVARILLLGVTGKITVAGSTFNGSMPAFGTTLSDEEIAAVASHVRSSFGNHAPALTADVVKAERATIGNRTAPWAGEDELRHP
ncbi:cytochrome C [Burkholderia ubonensis]|uniref:c-type cytochrome n=1 Tax=Burkholderia ubonensis TaxID=101571 RepID=UPI00075EBB33|nr:cytochrome c [Burkholderia ubonensis]KVH69840.1 cytochrome C [Burkholderia ubonensis]KVL63611.1 cytochrome C [Burkholderia ubonensis]KVL72308.1 cytochrome C [Burkholderia ubonensis]KVL80769.1 cytochrome C [Burkholderia ubonensis]KVU06896.1 cytochrome C [Burkholderia ubonensis]